MKTVFSFFAFLFFLGINFNAHAQLTGTKTIPGDYPSIAAAVTALTGNGVGSGGVTFNVAAGHTETSSNLVIVANGLIPDSSKRVVFQKNGVGANPLITAAPGVSSTLDGIIRLSGADYITFDRIDLLDPVSNTGIARMEWGFALLRASTTDGSQNNVIKNCTITLQKANTASVGIYLANHDTAQSFIYNTGPPGQNSYNKFYGNSISNVYKGIVAVSDLFSRDINNEIGVNGLGVNLITDLGGSNQQAEGIRCAGQENTKINNNVINGGAGTTNRVAGIIAEEYEYLDYEISYNQVTVTSDTYVAEGIQAYGAYVPFPNFDTILIHHNIVENCVANSGVVGVSVYAGYVDAAYIYNNIIRNNTDLGSGASTLLVGSNSTIVMHSNEVYGNQKTGISGTMECIRTGGFGSIECYSNMVYNNSITNSSGTSPSTMYGYIGYAANEKVYNNVFYNLSVGGTNTSTSSIVVGVYSGSSNNEIYGNQIYGLSGTSTTGGVYGIYSTSSGTNTIIHKNKIHNLTNHGTTGTTAGCWVSSGTSIQIYNNFISELKAPNSANANAVIGINCTSTTTNSTVGIYFNSIYLSGTGGSSFGSSGISVTANATTTTAALDMQNNIIINLSTPGSTSGRSVAYRRSSVNLQNYAATSDYNIFYAGTPSARQLIFYDGTNSDQTLGAYQIRVAPRDANSKSVPVNFVDPVNGDLHLAGASISDPNLIGTPISGITTDIDGHIRSTTTPYKGADEPSVALVLYLKINLQACSPMPDTITVFLRDTVNPYVIIDSVRGVTNANGEVTLNFANAVNGARYYIVVKHRNSIETWSNAGGEIFTGGVLIYDFTTAASQAFGNNMVLVGSEYSFYTGDVNQDEVVDVTDAGLIDNDAFNFVTGYVPTDLNCDMVVDVTDAAFADNNGFNFVAVVKP
ncbi:MAG: right-handed parallel beta-helix repeat-containing protein [Bacteroidota bacterium]|nr:right-handed parallel beta-helix repeat-containing protein [Bacteroidota bacterium]